MHMSGRRELFPDELIANRAPTIRVENRNNRKQRSMCSVMTFAGTVRSADPRPIPWERGHREALADT